MSDLLHIFVLEECDTEEDRWDYCVSAHEWLQCWKVPADGAKTPCVPWGDYELTIQEAKRRVTEMIALIGDKELWVKCFFKAPRRLQRRRKNAPTHIRVKARLMSGFERRGKKGEWFAPETNKQMAKALGVSESTIERAFAELADDPDLKFRVMAAEKGRGHKRVVALVSWLKYDEEPMLFDVDGKSRQIYTSMRKDREQVKPVKRITFKRPRHGRKTTNRHFCLSYSIRDKSQQNEEFNKASVPSAMMKLAFGILRDHEIPHFNRLEIQEREVQMLLARELRNGALRSDARKTVFGALRITDTAMADFSIRNPAGYAQGVIDRGTKKRVSREKIRQINDEFWRVELVKNEKELQAAIEQNDILGSRILRSLVKRCQAKLVA